MVKLAILMSSGVAVGSVLSYWINSFTHKYIRSIVGNISFCIVGCYAIGLLIDVVDRHFEIIEILRLLFPLGFGIGYLLFSLLSEDTLEDIKSGKTRKALLRTSTVVTLSFLAVWAGLETID